MNASTTPPRSRQRAPRHGHANALPPGKRRSRGRAWLFRGVALVLGLMIALLIITQIVLWTTLPQDIVLAKLQTQFGLRTQAKSLTAGWFTTSLKDVKLALPLAEQSVVEVAELRVRHNWLPLLLLQGPALKSVELDRPVLHVWQSTDGRWNIAEVMELLARAGGKKSGQDSARTATPSSPPELPNLVISDATVFVATAGGKQQEIQHVEIRGQAEGPLVWRYDVSIAGRISLVGKVAPGDTWSHQVTVNVKPEAADLLRPWMANVPPFELVDGKWAGRFDPGGLVGRLDIGELKVGNLKVSGGIDASNSNGGVQLRPVKLALETSSASRVVATGGSLSFDGKTLAANGLQVQVAGGEARIDASMDSAASGGNLSVLWDGLTLSPNGANGARTSGSLSATFATRLAGRPEIRGTLATRGWLSATRSWNGKLQINGDGSSWQDIDWTINAPTLSLDGQQQVRLNGLSLALRSNGPDIALSSITLPDTAEGAPAALTAAVASADNGQAVRDVLATAAPTTAPVGNGSPAAVGQTGATTPTGSAATVARHLAGSGDFNFATQAWWIKLSGRGWPVPQIDDETLGFDIDTAGTKNLLTVNDLSLRVADAVVRATGRYVYAEPAPVHLQVELMRVQTVEKKRTLAVQRAQTVEILTNTPQTQPSVDLLNGDVHCTVNVTGKTKGGLDLAVSGKLAGRNVRIRGHRIGDFDGSVHGFANDTLAKFYTDPFVVLGANLGVNGFYRFDEAATTLGLSIDRLRLEDPRVQALLQRNDLAGDFKGQWNLYIPGIQARGSRLRGTGWLAGTNLLLPNFAASDLHADISLDQNKLVVPIELRRPAIDVAGNAIGNAVKEALSSTTAPTDLATAPGKVDSDGHIRLSIAVDLTKPNHITIANLNVIRWPYPVPAANAALSLDGGSSGITVDLPNSSKTADFSQRLLHFNSRSIAMTAGILTPLPNGEIVRMGNCDLVIELEDRVADIRNFSASLLGASLDANAIIDLDHPMLASARLWVRDVDFNRISQVVPAARMVQGRYNLAVSVTPATSPASLEPLQIDVALHSDHARVGKTDLGDGRLRVYANIDPSWGLLRLVSEDEQPHTSSIDRCPPVRLDPRVPNQNTLEVAGGMLRIWGRFVRNENEAGIPGATSLSSHLWLGFKCLDLNQLAHAVDLDSPQMPGKFDGAMDLYGTTRITMPQAAFVPGTQLAVKPPTEPFMVRLGRSLYGDGHVTLRDADIANFGPIAFLYNLMHIGGDKRGPTGTGDVVFRIEGGNLNITGLHYFNRGVEVRAVALVADLAKVPDSPLSGTAVGSAQPLRNLKLPILRSLLPDINDMLSAFESNAASVRIAGTLHKPQTKVIVFGDIGKGLKEIIAGDVQAETQGSAGQ